MTFFSAIGNFARTSDYVALYNGCLITDLIFIYLLNTGFLKTRMLKKWYDLYGLAAVLGDTLIIFLGLIIARYVWTLVVGGEDRKFNLFLFIGLALLIQITHDVLFYWFFKTVAPGRNRMLDVFKAYAKETGVGAIIGDSSMMISAALIASYLAGQSLNTNLIVLFVSIYLVPYFVYQ